ncbi:MAG TPA: twin-arginine translocase subunit TatC [Opitutaceae bacterium]|jgi:sec-independent protein translocase protein TatC|nr:twin-arginine translocase subunit TatC [Opitutaceae bacterium]
MPEDLEIMPAEGEEGGPRKPFLEHLEDLRKALLRCVAVVFIALVVCLFLDAKLAEILEYPIRRMHLLDKPRPTMTFVFGSVRLGPYDVSRDDFPGLPPGDAPHVVFKVGLAKIGGDQVPTLTIDPQGDPGVTRIKLRNFNPAEGFMVAFHIAIYGSLVISAPFWLYFLGQFILPALHVRERKFLFIWLGWGVFLFMAGVLLTYFVLLPLALRASIEYSTLLGFDAYEWRAEEYISFTCKFLLGMGLGFQFPLVVLTLVKLGILHYRQLAHFRRHVWVAAFIIGAVLTTPEVITQVAMAVPLCLLYEICIWLAWFWERKKRREAAAAPA